MKKFSQLTPQEKDSLTKLEYIKLYKQEEEEKNPFTRRSCYDCSNMKAAMSWWCSDQDAIKARGTSIPGCIKCPFWKPEWKYISSQYKTKENGYIPKVRIKLKWYQKLFKALNEPFT